MPFALAPYPLLVQFTLAMTGFYFGWVYLRFFDSSRTTSTSTGISISNSNPLSSLSSSSQPQTLLRGDRSDAFAFDTFFPPVLEPYIKTLARVLTRIGTATGIIPKESPESREARHKAGDGKLSISLDIIGGSASSSINNSDYERKKAIALKALDARMMNK